MVRGSYLFVLALGCVVVAALEARAEHRGQQHGRSAGRGDLAALLKTETRTKGESDDRAGQLSPEFVADVKAAVGREIRVNLALPDGQMPAQRSIAADVQTADDEPHPLAALPNRVHTDYREAMKEAAEDRKMLFIYFHDSENSAARRAFEKETLSNLEIQEKLRRYVILQLPRDAQIQVDGRATTLLQHPAFHEMLGRQGVAVIDLVHERADYYGHVVSTFPFTPGKFYRKDALSIVLDLPPGTLTQRTMIYAVRIHPERPASTQGQFHETLRNEANKQSFYQASIQLQGHHSWDSRFHRINSQLPAGVLAQEVVAESWPNENLVEACIDCVHSWRQSPGHWGAVLSRHPLFGYDIKRGRNGIWYATGIFGRRR